MLRLFVRLYLPLVIVLAVYLLGVAVYSGSLLKNTAADHLHSLTRGTHYLVMQRLGDLPVEAWDKSIRELNQQFGYPIALHTLASLKPESVTPLRHNAQVFDSSAIQKIHA